MEYLVIGPGAMGYFAMLGYLKTIEPSLKNVKEISGASAGAIIAIFLALGYSVDDILEISLREDISDLVKLNLKCFIDKFGFIDIDPIREKFKDVFGYNPTFSQLKKKIYISSFCVNTSRTEYFSVDTHPEMRVIDALCMSITVPFLFSSVKYNDRTYIDGGTIEQFPMTPFIDKKPDKILCIKLKMDTQYIESIDTPREFAEALIASTLNNRRYDDVQNSKTKDIDIGEINIFNFKMSYEEKLQLYLIGVKSQ